MRPLLAETLNSIDQVQLPCYGSFKIDGFRVYKKEGIVYVGREGKQLNNKFAHDYLKTIKQDNFDGEMTIRNLPFHKASGKLRSVEGEPDFQLHLFDSLDLLLASYKTRLSMLLTKGFINHPRISILEQVWISTKEQAQEFMDLALNKGHEGICLRSPEGIYKHGRSTLKEFILVKWKPFVDDEAVCIGFEEQLENRNEATRNEFGLIKRSTHQANLFAKGTMGKIIGKWNNLTIKIGTGFDDLQREEYWNNQPNYIGKPFTFKYQKHGTDVLPRTPVFKSFREIS